MPDAGRFIQGERGPVCEPRRRQADQRIARLARGVCVVKVEPTELELKERKPRVEDALHATRAAIEQGSVYGGGVALLPCRHLLHELEATTLEQKAGA